MTNQQFFLCIGIVTLVLVVSFFFGKQGSAPPSKLDLKAGNKTKINERNLNLIFLFKGQSFDAYEVMGLPAGVQMEIVHSTHDLMRKKNTDPESLALMESAYEAIRQEVQRKS